MNLEVASWSRERLPLLRHHLDVRRSSFAAKFATCNLKIRFSCHLLSSLVERSSSAGLDCYLFFSWLAATARRQYSPANTSLCLLLAPVPARFFFHARDQLAPTLLLRISSLCIQASKPTLNHLPRLCFMCLRFAALALSPTLQHLLHSLSFCLPPGVSSHLIQPALLLRYSPKIPPPCDEDKPRKTIHLPIL